LELLSTFCRWQMSRGSSVPPYLVVARRCSSLLPINAKVLHANEISRQRGTTVNAGFHLLKAKHGVVISASQFCVPSASTAIVKPSNARDGADDHAALSAIQFREPS
jgi:hypothetical protein